MKWCIIIKITLNCQVNSDPTITIKYANYVINWTKFQII